MHENSPDTGTIVDTATTTITATENGPYVLTGAVRVQDFDGRVIETPSTGVYLCRCGLSAAKPFCDGTHVKRGFDGALAP